MIDGLDPLHGDGYQFWSGIGGGSPLFVVALLFAKHFNCHAKGCWRVGHSHPDHGLPVCRRHYRQPPKVGDE